MVSAAAFADPVQVTVNGNPVRFDAAQPAMIGGRVFVPLRGVFEQMGANVDWDSATQTVMADGNDRHIRLRLGSLDASVNGRVVTMDVAPQLMEGSTMVPLRFLGEALGAHVDWQPQNNLVAIWQHDERDGRAQRLERETNPPPPPPAPVQPAPPQVIIERVPVPVAPPPAPERPREMKVTISRDNVIPMRLDQEISSNHSQPGDKITATITDAGARYLNFPEGTIVQGEIRQATPASGSHAGTLDVRFTHIVFPDGQRYRIGGVVTRWDDKDIVRTDNGRYVAKNTIDKSLYSDAAIGAGAGLFLGSLSGKAVGGAVIGGTIGAIVGALDHNMARNVIFQGGTRMALVLDRDLTVDQRDLQR
jgi:uncharacterized membrane protein